MTPQVSLRQALTDPALLANELAGDSWAPWRAILLAAMGERLEPDELDLFRRLTGRPAPPTQRVSELWGVAGRRGGKSKAISVLTAYLAALVDHSDALTGGERGVALCIAPDQRQAKIILDYATAAFEQSPILRQLIASRTADTLELTNRISIEVRSASFRRIRGLTCVAVIADECSFWFSDDSSNPDVEILSAARPTLATTGGPLIAITSPHARKGEVWDTFRKHYGAEGDPSILVVQGDSRTFNPSLAQSVIDAAYQRDPARALAEYGAQFRTDVESFVTIESIHACIAGGVRERAPDRQNHYYGFVDPSGGSSDSFTMAIAHSAGDSQQRTAILDLIREVKPPFSPEAVTQEFADVLRSYRITKVYGDQYAGEWPKEQFRKFGVVYEPIGKSKSQLYLDFLPLINSRAVDLLDHDKLTNQLVGLERTTARGGRDTIDHARGAHDDIANSVAGAIHLANRSTQTQPRTDTPKVLLRPPSARWRPPDVEWIGR